MDFLISRLRIELNNLIEDYRDKGIPAYLLSGVLAQEQLRMKEWELAELTVACDKIISQQGKKEDGQGIQ